MKINTMPHTETNYPNPIFRSVHLYKGGVQSFKVKRSASEGRIPYLICYVDICVEKRANWRKWPLSERVYTVPTNIQPEKQNKKIDCSAASKP